jgi:hypothetical protein
VFVSYRLSSTPSLLASAVVLRAYPRSTSNPNPSLDLQVFVDLGDPEMQVAVNDLINRGLMKSTGHALIARGAYLGSHVGGYGDMRDVAPDFGLDTLRTAAIASAVADSIPDVVTPPETPPVAEPSPINVGLPDLGTGGESLPDAVPPPAPAADPAPEEFIPESDQRS